MKHMFYFYGNAIILSKLLLGFVVTMLLFIPDAFPDSNLDVEAANDVSESQRSEVIVSELPLWEAGVFGLGLSQPAYPGAEDLASRFLALPYVIYRGKYLRIDRGTVGVRTLKTPRTEMDIGFSGSLGSRASDIEARSGMDDLGILLGFGPRLKVNLGDISNGLSGSRLQFALRGVFDANDHFSYHGNAFEPQWVTDYHLQASWIISTSLGAVFGDQQLVDTFYRVLPKEATNTRQAYEAKSGLISLRGILLASGLITDNVRIFSYVQFDSVEGAANYNSPLVRRDNGWTLVAGFAWTLARSGRRASD